jgi:uncharacterized protein
MPSFFSCEGYMLRICHFLPHSRMDPIVHFEIPYTDKAAQQKFYEGIFGWKMMDWTMPDGSVHVGIHTTAIDEKTRLPLKPGAINGMLVKHGGANAAPVVTAHVASIDERVKQIEAAGGSVAMPKVEVPGMGWYIYVKDPEGNVVGMWEDMKKA